MLISEWLIQTKVKPYETFRLIICRRANFNMFFFQFWALETYNLLILHPKQIKIRKNPKTKDKNALDTDDGNSNLPKIGPTISRWRRDDAMLEEP